MCNGTCQAAAPCGAQGQACCPAEKCNSGLACASGSCKLCGSLFEPCCGNVCDLGLTCDANKSCFACGTEGALCCLGWCSPGLSCVSLKCVKEAADCGHWNQPCCNGQCYEGYCKNNKCH